MQSFCYNMFGNLNLLQNNFMEVLKMYTVAEALKLLNERCTDDNAYVFSFHTDSVVEIDKPVEYACIGIKIMNVSNIRIMSERHERRKPTQAVVISIDSNELDFFNPLTVTQLKNVLESIEDKSILVCATRTALTKGWLPNVVNLDHSTEIEQKNETLRKHFGENILHLFV